jgi:ATP-dependent exoDNAse (exonuclease V) alpha subunit
LAYAVTCHRAQGSAARFVVVHVEDTPMVTRGWVYTAITVTVEIVIVVGSLAAVERAIRRRSCGRRVFAINVNAAHALPGMYCRPGRHNAVERFTIDLERVQ